MLGSPSGDFTAAATSPEQPGVFVSSVAVGDFNRDRNPDLAVTNQAAGNVSILLGSRSGDFTPAPTSPEQAGAGPVSLAVADFDRDRNRDLAVANLLSNNVTILLGSRSGDFTAAPTSPEPVGEFPFSVVAGQFNRGGETDLAIANSQDNDVSILLANEEEEVTIDFSVHGEGEFDPGFFRAQGITFTQGSFVGFVQGDEALVGPIAATLTAPISSLAVSVAPALQGTAEYTLTAFAASGHVVMRKSVTVTQDEGDPDTGPFGYFVIDLSNLSRKAKSFSLENRFVRSSFGFDQIPFAVSSVTYSLPRQ